MRRFVLTAFLAVALASPAQADVWEFSWTSDASGIRFFSVTPGVSDSSTSSHVTGSSMATVSAGAGGAVDIGFSTPAGLAALIVTVPDQVRGTVPVFMPTAPAGTVPGSSPGTPGWSLQGVGATGSYTWTGDAVHPDTFQIDGFGPGSGPSVEVAFSGTGRLLRDGVPTAQAGEPEPFLLCLGALAAALLVARRRGV